MAAITLSKVTVLRGLVNDNVVGSSVDNLVLVEVEGTTAATNDTLNLATYIPCTGVIHRVACSIDGATRANADTWSGTTITFASHTGSGAYKGLFLVKQ